MSGETQKDESGWSVDTLKYYIDALLVEHDSRYEQRFAAQEKAVVAALASAEKATDKAEIAQSQRNELQNKFREQLAAQAATFATKETVDQRFIGLDSKTDQRFISLESKTDGVIQRNSQLLTELRTDFTAFTATYGGRRSSRSETDEKHATTLALAISGVFLLLSIAGLIISIVLR